MMRAGSGEMLKPRRLLPERSSVVVGNLEPSEVRQVEVKFTAPITPCTTISHWCFFEGGQMLPANELPHLSCQVRVIQVE